MGNAHYYSKTISITHFRGITYVWWSGLDKEIAESVHDCAPCQFVRNKPPQASVQPLQWRKQPWQRIHVDFAGLFMNKMFLLVVDSHSKWLEIEIIPSTTSTAIIEKLSDMFSHYGLPDQRKRQRSAIYFK